MAGIGSTQSGGIDEWEDLGSCTPFSENNEDEVSSADEVTCLPQSADEGTSSPQSADEGTSSPQREPEKGNNASKEIMPEKWKPVIGSKRYCNPEEWNFRILKKTSFSLPMVGNMFSKYWNQPQMKNGEQGDGQWETVKGEEASLTLINEGSNAEVQNGTDATDKMQNAVTEETHDQARCDGGKEARQHPEVLSKSELQKLKEAPKDQIQILWIGHASLLIQMDGKNILTDPIFSDKAGPQNMIGYSRYRRPAVTVKMLKGLGDFQIDAVVISHNHYDHFDKQSVKDLNFNFPAIKWFVPMKMKSDLITLGCKDVQVKEAMWWESWKFDEDITFHFTPAKHWSGRNPTDWYTSLWGSWVIEGKTAKVYFAGDTGYQEEIFKAIKAKFDPITVAALPIGAYKPREMMECQHIDPEEAVKIHNILGVQKSIGIHWRTFQLSCEGIDEPIHDLKKAKEAHMVGKEDFITLETSLFTTIDCKKQDSICQGIDQPIHDLKKAKEAHMVEKENSNTLGTSLFTTIDCKKQDSNDKESFERDPYQPD